MKHAKFLFLMILLFLVTTSSQVRAAVYAPNTQRDMSANRAYCLGATASNVRFRYYTCSLGTGSNTGVPMTVSWYMNTVNSTSGGTLISTTSVTSAIGSSGSLNYMPSIASAGISYYYCIVTWTGAGTCNTSGTITSTITRITVSETPGAVTGNDIVCIGTPTTYTNSASGGTWTRSNTRLSIDASTGEATGITAGAVNITYTVACGTRAVKLVTVQAVPTVNAITGGNSFICEGASATLNCTPTGGTWVSGNTAVATIGTNRVVTAISAGTTTITYTRALTCGTASATKVVSVSETPGLVTGNSIVCIGTPTTYTNSASGGTWSRSNSRLNIDVNTGEANGVSAGSVRITYRVACGTRAIKTVTVQAIPTVNAITGGNSRICQGATATLNCSPTGGTWVSGNTSIATIGTNRVVTGISPGTATITYTRALTCGTVYTTKVVTATAIPAAITGDATTCASYTLIYGNTVPYGTWTSSNVARATVVSTTGEITAISAGTVRITYNTSCAPVATKLLTINASPAAITGTKLICGSGTTTLSTATGGGTWSSGNTAVATVNASGDVTAVSFGTAAISYTLATSCDAVAIVTVGATPAAISGTSAICSDGSAVLTNSVNYGVWSSGNTAVATIEADGTVTPVGQGTATITYATGCGTDATMIMSVYTQPVAITGAASICEGSTTTLSNATSGGVWSSDDVSFATVNAASGLVTGVADGDANIIYTNGVCFSTFGIAINPLPVPGNITGTMVVCEGDGTNLSSDGDASGAWSSSSTSNATVDASGLVTGVSAGTSNITYTVTNGCGTLWSATVVTVNADPNEGSIAGASSVCQGATTTLSDAAPGGVWSSSSVSVASVDASGVVSGVSGGIATISYSVSNACGTASATQDMTVDPLTDPGNITGTAVVCVSATTALSNATSGGVWSSDNTSVATVGTNGVVSGVSAGNATISYGVAGGCGTGYATVVVSVNAAASPIVGSNNICLGGNTTLTNADAGGVWSVSNAAIATVGAGTGVVTAVSLGATTITYNSASACNYATLEVTVSSTVPGITGVTHTCATQTSTLSNASAGGAWSSSNNAIATVDATSGEVTGIAPGSCTISYTIAGGCFAPVTFFVYANPVPITGVNTLCTGTYTVLYSTIGGSGTWISSDTTIANPHLTSGMINGIGVGTASITYRVPATGCMVSADVTVNLTPASISGPTAICVGATQTFSSSTGGGTWTSSQTDVATVNTTGDVTAITAGATEISYIMPTGCYATYYTTVNTLPSAISATASNICLGIGTTFSSATSGGTWSSGNTAVATINISSGVATSAGLGTSTITYTGPNSCATTTDLTVYSALSVISGNDVVCKGYATTLTNATSGGTWITSNAGIASISAGSGLMTGMSRGTAFISYRLSGGCLARMTVTVADITGNQQLCVGMSSTFAHIIPAGTWTSSNAATATIDAASGLATGVAPGLAYITYTMASGQRNVSYVVVSSLPAAISGASTICSGSSAVYTGTAGGSATWSSSNVSVATIHYTSGMATGVGEGITVLTYKVPSTGCYTTRSITIIPAPATITGSSTLCVASSTTLESATSGGTWVCTSNGVGTIGASTGCLTGGTAGGTTISYTLSNGCRKTKAMTVTPIPATITGPSTVTAGGMSTFSCATSGGTWSSSNPSIALPATTSGFSGTYTTSLISGISSGAATISYSLATGCSRTVNVTVVSAKPGAPIRSAAENDVEFSVYPNPTSGVFTITSPVNGVFTVYTFDGKMVQQYEVATATTSVSLPANLASGVYMCQFAMEDGTVKTAKLIYQR